MLEEVKPRFSPAPLPPEHARGTRDCGNEIPPVSDLPGSLAVRRHEGQEALRALVGPLRSAGFLPASIAAMQPDYLAEGFEGNQPGAVVAYSKGRPVAYVTYAVRRTRFLLEFGPRACRGLPCRQLRLFGYATQTDHHGLILDQFFQSLLEDKTWHVAQILDLPDHSPLAEYLRQLPIQPGRNWSLACKTFETFQVKIEEDFESYLRNNFNKKTRYNLKREVRLLEAAAPGQVATRIYSSPDQVAEFLRDARRIAQRTYQWKFGFNTLRAVPLAKVLYFAQHGRMRSYILFIRDVPVAYCAARIRRGALSYDDVGYDPQFAQLNPGKVLLYKILEDLHKNRAVRELEFGRGSAQYKRLFANSSRRALDLTLYRHEPYSQLLRLLASTADAGYQCLRPLIRPWVPHIKRRFRDQASA
ncbi:MAG: GNAT family N-acetyltransferase [Deltaproteobacteria bacterium]|nr:GNAT family N-acetyltransferase [Deltaproteobacteria bacterium]